MKRICVLFCVCFLMMSFQVNAAVFEGEGYDTPEDAVLAYLNGMNNGDVSEMLSTFAIESYVDHLDNEGFYRRISAYVPATAYNLPATGEYTESLMPIAIYSNIANSLLTQYAELTVPTDGYIKELREEADMQNFLNQAGDSAVNSWVGNVEFIRWVNPAAISDQFYDAKILCTLSKIIACAGGDDVAELAAHIKLNGIDAIQFMQCVKYEDRWYNLNFQGNLGNLYGVSSRNAGLLYPIQGSETALLEEIEPEIDNEIKDYLESWENSNLPGTCWKLESVDSSGITANVAESAEAVLEDPENSIFSNLKFMHLGGTVMDIRMSSSLRSALGAGDQSYMKTAAVWTEEGDRISFEASSGVAQACFNLDDAECIRNGDTIQLTIGDFGTLTFQRVQD